VYARCFKRVLDFAAAAVLCVLLAPLALLLAVAVRVRMGSPVVFRQRRVGLGEKLFDVLKLRSMTDARGPDGKPLPDRDRLTPLGAFLRRSSLDELPQLVNVLRGEMSLVGPRPLLERYLCAYTEREHLRHTVRPGITGAAQVGGRSSLPWDDQLEIDAHYAEALSPWRDLGILCRTVTRVLAKSDVNVTPKGEFLDEMRGITGSVPPSREAGGDVAPLAGIAGDSDREGESTE
jgi:lipopolysaccharide/colanic/teichoic acid biosynthesis glycosyltransferase